MSQAAANQLEAWFSSLPELAQSILHEPFTWMNESLKSVSGDPQALVAAAPCYVQFATTVTEAADAQLRQRDQLAAAWSGDAFFAVDTNVNLIDDQLRKLSDIMSEVPELLQAGAEACVEAANLIIDLIVGLVMFVVSLVITNLALLVVTAGASAAVAVTAGVARAAQAVAAGTRVITKLSRVLTKIAERLRTLQKRLESLRDTLQKIQAFLKDMKQDLKKFKGKEHLQRRGDFYTVNGLVTTGIKVATFGVVAPPTTGSSIEDAGKNYYDAARAAEKADDIAEEQR